MDSKGMAFRLRVRSVREQSGHQDVTNATIFSCDAVSISEPGWVGMRVEFKAVSCPIDVQVFAVAPVVTGRRVTVAPNS